MIYFLGFLGIAAFSITGVIAAGRRGMDSFSIVLLGAILFIFSRDMAVGPETSRLIGIGTILLLRILAIKRGMYYPGWLTFTGSQE